MVIKMWGKATEENDGIRHFSGAYCCQLLRVDRSRSGSHYTWACQLIYATGSVRGGMLGWTRRG